MAKMHFTQFTTLGLKTQYRAACARLLGPLDPGQRCLKQRVAENPDDARSTSQITNTARSGEETPSVSRDDDAVNDPLSLPRYVQYAGNKAKTFKCSAKTDRMQFGCSY
mmetsp:Transcript_16872/g.51140  ORF Transcript_16872/g.51140 Transcript_16872/m.51140 type:complete len:109 (-) Transcript_16872:728-1054(-)